MSYRLGNRSKANLQGIHPDLVSVVELAIKNTKVDFTVIEGVRSEARQRELFDCGASTTMNSRHLTGHAVDLAAWVGGAIRWDWPLSGSIWYWLFCRSKPRSSLCYFCTNLLFSGLFPFSATCEYKRKTNKCHYQENK